MPKNVTYLARSVRDMTLADFVALQEGLTEGIDKFEEVDYPPNVLSILDKLWYANATIHVVSVKGVPRSYMITYPIVDRKGSHIKTIISTDMFDDAHYVDDFYTHFKHRGKGYGKLILAEVCSTLKHLQLHVRETNPASIIYYNMGFYLVDRVPNFYYDSGKDSLESAFSMVYRHGEES